MASVIGKRTARSAPSSKKAKRSRASQDEPSVFVTQLASLAPSDDDSVRTVVNEFETNRIWSRPPLPAEFHTNESEIDFQVVDVDYFMNSENNVVIRLFGVTTGQNSVCVQVHGFLPYFYVLLESAFDEKNIEYAKTYLNDIIKTQVPANIGIPKNIENLIVDLDIVHGASIYEYRKNPDQKFLKVYVRSPKLLNLCRRVFTNGVSLTRGGQVESLSCFEANIDFEIRFMTDHDLVGCAW
uniref:3'-5' exodeoxyribonuclease n=1 Tax=Elaeophora elaphi TaxID=1147741 RepID=A0A0R3S6C9_9BILA